MTGQSLALRGVLTHRKTRRLAKLLGISPCFALGILEALWHTAAEQCPRGDIGSLSDQDIAEELFYEGDAVALVGALVEAGWLRVSEAHRLVVHDWSQHADQAVRRLLGRRSWTFADVDETRLVMSSHGPDMTCLPEPEPVSSIQSPEPEKDPPKSPQGEVFDPMSVPLPARLESNPKFADAWCQWFAYRRETKKPTWKKTTTEQALAFLAEQPDPVAIIGYSIRNGYAGLFEVGKGPKTNGKTMSERYEEMR